MSSSQRSSSGVRNLRALFENQDSSDTVPSSRGRSPAGSVGGSSTTDRSPAPSLGTRKVRASFVSVEPREREFHGKGLDPSSINRRSIAAQMSSTIPPENAGFGPADGSTQPAAVPTPLVEVAKQGELHLPTREPQAEHTEKVISSVEDPDAELQPINVSNENVGSNGSPGIFPASTLQGSPNRPSGVSSSKPSSASKPKTPLSPTSTKSQPKGPTKPARLSSHLMQQTASSAAKHEPDQVPTKPRPSSTTQRTIPVSSHLMAPTAASKARHETEASPTSPTAPKNPTKVAPKKDRSSLAGATRTAQRKAPPTVSARASNGIASQQPPTTTTTTAVSKPPSGDFLSRMTKPTSASSSRSHEKLEAKSPPQSKPAATASKSENASKPARTSVTKKSPPAAARAPAVASKSSPSQQPKATTPSTRPAVDIAEDTIEPPAVDVVTAPINTTETRAAPATEAAATAPTHDNLVSKASESITQQDDVMSSAEQWNAAALPRTPQTKAADESAMTPEEHAKKNLDPGRRSMMETPELENATIH